MAQASHRSVGRRAALAVTGLLAVAGGASCSDDLVVPAVTSAGTSAGTSASTSAGISAVVQQWREDEVRGVFMVTLWNRTDEAVRVSSLDVAWSGFASAATSRPDYSVGPGVRVDLAVPEVPARCAEPLRPDDVPPSPDGATVTVNGDIVVPVDDPAGVLARLHERSCHQQYVDAATGLRLGNEWVQRDVGGTPVAAGDLELHPAPGTDVTVAGTDGSLMMSLETTGPRTPLADGGWAVPVDVGRLGRCDAHALGENKQAYRFEVTMIVDGVTVQATLDVPTELRRTFRAVVERRCRIG